MKKLILVLVLFFAVSLVESYATPTFKKIGKTILSTKHRDRIIAGNRSYCKRPDQHYKQKFHKNRKHKFLFVRF